MLAKSYIPDRPAAWWKILLLPLVGVGVAWGARFGLKPLLGDAAPYIFFVGAVLVATYWGGAMGGALATIAGGLAANFSFIGMPNRFEVTGTELWDLLVFLGFCGLLVLAEEALLVGIRREMRLNEELSLVSSELRHRIKNMLTMTEALSQQTGRSSSSVEEFNRKLVSRLRALFSAQNLIVEEPGRPIPLRVVIGGAVAPFVSEERLVEPLGGPDVDIERSLVTPLALIFNELATNAVKYGALSTPEGRVRLGWRWLDGRVLIDWTEQNGPPVLSPLREGFGSRLMRSALPSSKGRTRLHFDPEGLRCEIEVEMALTSADHRVSDSVAALGA